MSHWVPHLVPGTHTPVRQRARQQQSLGAQVARMSSQIWEKQATAHHHLQHIFPRSRTFFHGALERQDVLQKVVRCCLLLPDPPFPPLGPP